MPVREQTALEYCEALAKRNSYCIGFVPRIRYKQSFDSDRLLVATYNGDLSGFALYTVAKKILKIQQVIVQEDCRRLDHATALIAAAVRKAVTMGAGCIRLRCAIDLEANYFWQFLGLQLLEVLHPKTARMRAICVWELDLFTLTQEPANPLLHASVSDLPGTSVLTRLTPLPPVERSSFYAHLLRNRLAPRNADRDSVLQWLSRGTDLLRQLTAANGNLSLPELASASRQLASISPRPSPRRKNTSTASNGTPESPYPSPNGSRHEHDRATATTSTIPTESVPHKPDQDHPDNPALRD